MDSNCTFLEEGQLFGDKALEIIKKYGTRAAITDFSILLGGYVSSSYYTNEGNTGKDRTGYYWTKTDDGDNDARVVNSYGARVNFNVCERPYGARPALPYSSIRSICSNEVRDSFGVLEVEYGEYPQTIVDESHSRELERAYNNGIIKVTGKTYTTDSVGLDDYNASFQPRQHQEFEYNGRKYIRFVGDKNGEGKILSDGREIKVGEVYWVAVEPIKWLVDEKTDIALSKRIIFSGVQFQKTRNYKGDFDKTDAKQFMDKCFSKDIMVSRKMVDLINIKLTLLEEEQLFGDRALDVIKKYGTIAKNTDLAVVRGGYNSDEGTGWYWTKDQYGSSSARVVASSGGRGYFSVYKRDNGARPALPYSSIRSICSNVVRDSDGILIVTCGEYPQHAADSKMQKKLHELYDSKKLDKTGKNYTFDSRKYTDYSDGFSPEVYDEYEYQGKKYIRVRVNSYYDGETIQLPQSDFACKDGDYVWIEVSPVEWIIDEKTNLAIAKDILVAGIRYDDENKYDGNFENTEMKTYLDKCMAKDMFQSSKLELNNNVSYIENEKKSRIQKLNPDTTNPQDRRRMTDTEIISSWIEAGQSVLLRGPSGIGKTERIKTLYPNLIYIKLTNNMFPEKVVGSMNLQTGQNIPPDFAKQALLACATDGERKLISENVQNLYDLADEIYERSKNSDEKIVIMLDELLNVKPAVQSLVYTLVLNRLVETGKGLKLPANTVIVATGNQKKYSSVAEDLAEPLEKRFDHILDMQPKVGEWINEYAIPNKIHPSVIGYILSKYIQSGKSEAISDMSYFYEEPEVGEKRLDQNGCKGRTNDPRGWASISNTLYAFEEDLRRGKFVGKDVEYMLEVSISSKLREEWAREFFDFYNIPTLSVEEVVTDSFSQADLPRDINERFACVTSLLLADENQVGKCRDFIRKHCDPEYLQLYDICWAGNDERKIMRITELQEMAMINEESAGKRL